MSGCDFEKKKFSVPMGSKASEDKCGQCGCTIETKGYNDLVRKINKVIVCPKCWDDFRK